MAAARPRHLGRIDVLCVVMGAMVGVGIFFQPGRVAARTGSAEMSLLAWALGGAIALAGALCFAEPGALFPQTGGQYVVLREAYGRPVGFLYCWALLTVIVSGAVGIIAMLCVRSLARAAGTELPARREQLAAVALIAFLALFNAGGLRRGARLSNLAMLLKAAAIGGIALVGLAGWWSAPTSAFPAAGPGPAASAAGGWLQLASALVPVLFSFGGWQQATYLAGEVKEPGRTLPFGIVAAALGAVAAAFADPATRSASVAAVAVLASGAAAYPLLRRATSEASAG